MSEKTQKQLIQETHETVGQLSTVLLGVPGTEDGGLVREVKDVKSHAISNTKAITKIKVIIAGLVGSGIIGGTIYSLLNGG